MKMMKAICTATVLALTLSIPAFAGDISTPGCTTDTSGAISTTSPADTTISVWDSATPALLDWLSAFIWIF